MTNNKVLCIVIAVLVLIVIGGGLIFLFSNKAGQKETGAKEQTATSPSTATQTPVANRTPSAEKIQGQTLHKPSLHWIERRPAGGDDFDWIGVASSADGSHLVAVNYEGHLYTSSDYGASWTERHPGLSVLPYRDATSDVSGRYLAVVNWDGRLYTSADYGVSWTERQPAGNIDVL